MAVCTIINGIEWLMALAICGWEPMQFAMILGLLAYSVYLTLNDYIFVFYIFMTVGSITHLMYGLAELNEMATTM